MTGREKYNLHYNTTTTKYILKAFIEILSKFFSSLLMENRSIRGVVANVLHCNILDSGFKFQLGYYIRF